MRIHYLQHMPFENPGNIIPWAESKGHILTGTLLYDNQPLPSVESFDWLVILGGTMNAYEHKKYPWLVQEKEFIDKTIRHGASVLGICLGAQLISDVLGGRVTRNLHREIGWFPISLTPRGRQSGLFRGFRNRFMAFHWHGDTFSIPPNASHVVRGEACDNQAFQYGKHVLGLQFHLDYTREGVETMIRNCSDELLPGPYVQSPSKILALDKRFQNTNKLLCSLLNSMERNIH
jgi:GMP synthase-like glutamine amidotransferase